ncbi:hypothetical protein ABTC92_18800, partial [Acinetobacter baumannii]
GAQTDAKTSQAHNEQSKASTATYLKSSDCSPESAGHANCGHDHDAIRNTDFPPERLLDSKALADKEREILRAESELNN